MPTRGLVTDDDVIPPPRRSLIICLRGNAESWDEGNCTENGTCYVRRTNLHGKIIIELGCYECRQGPFSLCSVFCGSENVTCCREDYCNTYEKATLETTAQKKQDYSYIIIPAALLLVVCLTVILMPVLFCTIKKCVTHQHMDDSSGCGEVNAFDLIGSNNTAEFDAAESFGSGSGLPVLIQRTIARSINLGLPTANGRFGQVFVGEYQGEKVAVKKFSTRDELSWCRECEIYSTVSLRHDNILVFFASDVFSGDGMTELWLITQYHPHGSLFDYLNKEAVSPDLMMRMAISICRGLAYLHTGVQGISVKPAIAHRDIKSKNILVKENLECCIADFGLSVVKDWVGKVKFPTNPKQGTKRYMAPEILTGTIDVNIFESLLLADVYAMGLVLWEICSRCQLEMGM